MVGEVNTAPVTDPTTGVPLAAGNAGTYYSLPDYYTDPARDLSGFIQDYLGGMMAPGGLAGGYTGPRVASEDPLMTTSYGMATTAAGVANPYLQAGANWQQTGADWATQAHDYMGQAPNYFSTGAGMISDSYGGLGAASNYLQRGGQAYDQASALTNASSTYDPSKVQEHLNPYVNGVLSEIARLGNENLFENLIPNVNSTFVGNGQFGSSRNGDFLNTAIQKTQREILGQQATTLKSAYDSAGADYLNWSKQGLDSARTLNDVGSGLGQFADQATRSATAGADIGSTYSNVGGQVSDHGTALINAGSTLGGLGQQYGQYGVTAGDNAWSNVDNTYNSGLRASTYDQSVLDNAYNDWTNRWKQPTEQASALSGILAQLGSRVTPDSSSFDATQAQQTNNYSDVMAILEYLQGMDA